MGAVVVPAGACTGGAMNTLKDLIGGAGCAPDGSATVRNPLGNVVSHIMESVPSGLGMSMGRGGGTVWTRRVVWASGVGSWRWEMWSVW